MTKKVNSIQDALKPKRFEVRRGLVGSIKRELCTDDIEAAASLFFFLKEQQDRRPGKRDDFMDDIENFCVWDNQEMNVAFHEGKYLTTYLLKEDEYADSDE